MKKIYRSLSFLVFSRNYALTKRYMMRGMSMFCKKITLSISVILLLAMLCSCANLTDTGGDIPVPESPAPTKTYLALEVGSMFPGYEVTDEDGNTIMTDTLPGGNKLVLYSWDECIECIENYDNYAEIIREYDSEELNVLFIWTTTIPFTELDIRAIPRGNSYSQTGSYIRFNNWVPTYFYIDENNTILFKDTDITLLTDFLVTL
jgi:hypothetical protein